MDLRPINNDHIMFVFSVEKKRWITWDYETGEGDFIGFCETTATVKQLYPNAQICPCATCKENEEKSRVL